MPGKREGPAPSSSLLFGLAFFSKRVFGCFCLVCLTSTQQEMSPLDMIVEQQLFDSQTKRIAPIDLKLE
jgi:hypothetical protein